MSTFSKLTAKIVRQIDPDGSLIHVSRINNADKLVPMAIVVRQGRRYWWQRPKYKYQPHDFTLSDIFQGETPLNADVSEMDILSYQGSFGEVFTGHLRADVGVASAQLDGQITSRLQSDLGKLKKQKVDVKKLRRDSKNRSVNLQHQLVRRLKRGHVLALLTERIVTTSTCVVEQRSCKGFLGKMANTVSVCVKIKNNVQKASLESIEIPPGTVIAYSLLELEINKENGDFEIGLHDDDIESDCFFEKDGQIPDKTPELQNPQVYLSPLAELPQESRSALFQMFCEVMKDRDALSDVEDTLEEWCTGDASVCHSNSASRPLVAEEITSGNSDCSASAMLDVLRPNLLRTHTDCHIESGGPGSAVTPGSPLTAVHLLVSAMEALPDEALNQLSESTPDVLEAFNTLLNMLDLKDQKESCSPLPLESVPLPLQDDKAFDWMQQLLITCNVNFRSEAGGLSAERESNAGVLPLVLCVTVQGLSYLCDQQN